MSVIRLTGLVLDGAGGVLGVPHITTLRHVLSAGTRQSAGLSAELRALALEHVFDDGVAPDEEPHD